MAYLVLTIACDDEDAWGAALLADLEAQEVCGYTLVAMTTRTVALPQAHGQGMLATRYGQQLVCVLHHLERRQP